jgi:FkbM family methyltransferase
MKNAAQPLQGFDRALLSFVRHTPLNRGAARKFFIHYFCKHIYYPVMTDFRGIPFILNLDNTTEQKALFGHYDLIELDFLKAAVADQADPVFVDIGANSGFYTQNFLALGKGRSLSIEPNPDMRARVLDNYAYLQQKSKQVGTLLLEECAIGAEKGRLYLDLSKGYGGAHIVSEPNANTFTVDIEPLDILLDKNNITYIDILKIDVEGYEDRALVPFITHTEPARLPRHIIMEHTSADCWEHDLLGLLQDKGYRLVTKTRGNLLLSRTV